MGLTEADKRVRSNGVGSSEIAMLVYLEDQSGDVRPLSPWGGRHKLWRKKTGREIEERVASHLTRGDFMEEGLIKWYASDHDVEWRKPRSKRSTRYKYVVDSVDALTYPRGSKKKGTPLRCVEAKTSNPWMRHEWGQPGTDEIPNYYLVQCQWHLGVWETQDEVCDVPMDNGMSRKDYFVPYDEELYHSLLMEAERFWRDYVETDREPPIDDAKEATRWLSRYLENKDGLGVKEANADEVQLLLRYRSIALQRNAAIDALAELQEKIQRAIGAYDGLMVPGTKQQILWKQTADSIGVNWQEVSMDLYSRLQASGDLDEQNYQLLLKRRTKVTKKGTRRFCPDALLKNSSQPAGER